MLALRRSVRARLEVPNALVDTTFGSVAHENCVTFCICCCNVPYFSSAVWYDGQINPILPPPRALVKSAHPTLAITSARAPARKLYQDTALGQFLIENCFNPELKCQNVTCKRSARDHLLSFVHNDGRVDITVGRTPFDLPAAVAAAAGEAIARWAPVLPCLLRSRRWYWTSVTYVDSGMFVATHVVSNWHSVAACHATPAFVVVVVLSRLKRCCLVPSQAWSYIRPS